MSSEPFDPSEYRPVGDDVPSDQDGMGEVLRRLDDLESDVADANERGKAAMQLAERALDVANETAEQLGAEEDSHHEEIETLRDDLDELRDRTDIFQHVTNASGMDTEQRAAVCIQKCYSMAQADPNDRGTLTVAEAWKMLDATEVDRTRYYDIFEIAEELVGDVDVCWYQTEPRGHDPPSRLIVDLDGGRLPSQIKGVRMRSNGGDE